MNSEKYIKSKAFKRLNLNDNYEIVNIISGKTFSIDCYIYDLINFCSKWKKLKEITEYMLKDGYSEHKINLLLSFLVNNKILLKNEKDIYCELVKYNRSCFNVGYSDLNKISNKIAFVGIPFGLGNSIDTGCKDYPDKFRDISTKIFSFNEDIDAKIRKCMIHETFDLHNFSNIVKNNLLVDLGNIYYCNGEPLSLFHERISSITAELSQKKIIPFFLGGDHSITYPIVKGLSIKNKEFVILHFDAHSDFRESDILKLYKESGIDLLNHATVMSYCEKCNEVSSIYQFGVREPNEIISSKIVTISIYDIRKNNSLLDDIINKSCSVYLTFDIDFFDPTIAPGTASKIINGGGYDETFNCIYKLLKNKKIIGVDIVEVNPRLDFHCMTIQLSINLSLQILGLIRLL